MKKKIKNMLSKKRIKCFSKTFIITIIVVLGLLAVCWYISEFLDNRTTSEISFPAGIEIDDYDEYMESQKDFDSDIDGMSVYDKYVMGLQVQEGADSDYDGLTDKEEIEVYGTDPLAASTAGDLYFDGYKIENGLDPFTYMEYEDEMVFPYIECPEVMITANVPTDFNTVVQDYTDVYSLEEYNIKTVYKGYCFYNYGGGTVSIDLSDIMAQNDVALHKLNVYVANDMFLVPGMTELNKCAYEADGEIITLSYDFDDDMQYLIYITGKRQLSFNVMLEDIADSFCFNGIDGEGVGEEFIGNGIIYGSPILDQFFGVGLKAYYGKRHNEENTKILFNVFTDYCDPYKGMPISNANIHSATETQVLAKQKLFDAYLSYFEWPMDNEDTSRLRNAFFFYTKYETVCNSKRADVRVSSADTQFDKNIDELPFQNFESYIALGGNCAGISHLTSYLYNTKTIPASGAYECKINGEPQTVTWDVSNDQKNETLRDPGLYDYKTKKFIDKLSEENSNYIHNGLTDGEKEFVNMIGCFWAEGNDKLDNSHMLPSGTLEEYSVLENMMNYLDQGKILDVYLYMSYGGGHAVNIYGYEHTQYEDQTVFFIYDNNIPCDDRAGFYVDKTNGTCMLQTIKVHDKGGNDKFVYLYWPMSGYNSYLATNIAGRQQYHMIVAMEEDWKVIN